jgi:hypothetical protein
MITKNYKNPTKEKEIDINDPAVIPLKSKDETIFVIRPYINFVNSMMDIYD